MYSTQKEYLKSLLPECLLGKFDGYLAGGAMTSIFMRVDINDYDLYPRNEKAFKDCLSVLSGNSFYLKFVSEKSLTFIKGEYKIQVIHYRFFNDHRDVFSDFDFDANMGAYDFIRDEILLHDSFLPALASKDITINKGTKYPLISLVRLKKYQEKGFNFKPTEILKLAIRTTQLNINSWEDLEDQVGGVYGELCLNQKNPPKFSIDYAIDNFNSLFRYSDENENVGMDEFMRKTGITDKDWLKANEGDLFQGDCSNGVLQF